MKLRKVCHSVLFLTLMSFSFASNAEYEDASDGVSPSSLPSLDRNYDSPEEVTDALQQYVMRGEQLVASFNVLIEDYEAALNGFKDYRENCKNSSSSSSYSGKLWNGARGFCSNEKLSGLQSRLKNLGKRLDGLEVQLEEVKGKMKFATESIQNAIKFTTAIELAGKAESKESEAREKERLARELEN